MRKTPILETIDCLNCGSPDSRLLFEVPDYLLERPEPGFPWRECLRCGLVFQSPRPGADEMDAHYPAEYAPFQTGLNRLNWLQRRSVGYGMRTKFAEISAFERGGRLLDVGCATGEFLLEVNRHRGWAGEGVEPSAFAAEVARQQGLSVFGGTLEEARYPSGSFDAVTLWDVLEHIHRPDEILQEIQRITRPGGVLAMRFPNAASFDRQLFGKTWIGYDAPRHLFVYSPATIRDLLGKAGFRLLRVHTRHGAYMSFILSIRFWMTARRNPARERVYEVLKSLPLRMFFLPASWLYALSGRASQLSVVAVREG